MARPLCSDEVLFIAGVGAWLFACAAGAAGWFYIFLEYCKENSPPILIWALIMVSVMMLFGIATGTIYFLLKLPGWIRDFRHIPVTLDDPTPESAMMAEEGRRLRERGIPPGPPSIFFRAAQLFVRNEIEAKKERLELHRNRIRSMLQNEDVPENPFVRIRFRFSNKSHFVKMFRGEDSLESLFNFVFIHPECPEQFSLLTGYPMRPLTECVPQWYRQEFHVDGPNTNILTFSDAGLHGSIVVVIQDDSA